VLPHGIEAVPIEDSVIAREAPLWIEGAVAETAGGVAEAAARETASQGRPASGEGGAVTGAAKFAPLLDLDADEAAELSRPRRGRSSN
jgi:hypothetical protein